jgi:hypothetical protein
MRKKKKIRIRHKISWYSAKQWEDHRRRFNGKCGQPIKQLFLYSGGLHRLNVYGLTIKNGTDVAAAFHIRLHQSHIRRRCKHAVTPVQVTPTNHKRGPVYFTNYHLTMLPFHLHDWPQCLPSPSYGADDAHTEGKSQGLGVFDAGFYCKKLWSITPRTA